MQNVTKGLLVLLYPLLLLAWLVNVVLGRDRLQLHRVADGTTCWIERRAQPNTVSYFSEGSYSEGSGRSSAATPVIWALRIIAGLYKPRQRATEMVYKASAEREEGIPDEVYTLW